MRRNFEWHYEYKFKINFMVIFNWYEIRIQNLKWNVYYYFGDLEFQLLINEDHG